MMAYCVDCGSKLEAENIYCTGCGKPVLQNSPSGSRPESAPSTKPDRVYPVGALPVALQPPERGDGRNPIRVASIIVLVGFVMPWISCPGLTGRETMSGIQLASRGASPLWVIPISMLVALGVLMNKGKSIQERATAAKVAIGSGIASLTVMLYYYAVLNGAGQKDELGLGSAMSQGFSIELGAILSFLGSIGVSVGGFFHLKSPTSHGSPIGDRSAPAVLSGESPSAFKGRRE